MEDRKLIPLIRLYTINKIREIRLDLFITATELGKVISPSGNKKFISTIEAMNNEAAYTDHALNLIAIEFTRKAKEIQLELDKDLDNTLKIKTEYTVHDFFPPEPIEDIRVEKVIIPLPPGTGPAGTLNYLLETDHWFNNDHTIREITEYCNEYKKENWPPGNFSGLCFRLWKKGKLIRTEIGNDDILYRNSKPLEL